MKFNAVWYIRYFILDYAIIFINSTIIQIYSDNNTKLYIRFKLVYLWADTVYMI